MKKKDDKGENYPIIPKHITFCKIVNLYQGLADAVRANEARDAGSFVILSSSYIGSPKHMAMNYQDAMAIVRKKKKTDLFITFTCNPNWQEYIV